MFNRHFQAIRTWTERAIYSTYSAVGWTAVCVCVYRWKVFTLLEIWNLSISNSTESNWVIACYCDDAFFLPYFSFAFSSFRVLSNAIYALNIHSILCANIFFWLIIPIIIYTILTPLNTQNENKTDLLRFLCCCCLLFCLAFLLFRVSNFWQNPAKRRRHK